MIVYCDAFGDWPLPEEASRRVIAWHDKIIDMERYRVLPSLHPWLEQQLAAREAAYEAGELAQWQPSPVFTQPTPQRTG